MSQIRHEPNAPTHTRAFPTGGGIDRHRHDEDQLVYVAAGVVAVTTAHGAWVASPQRAVLVPAGVWHEHRFYGRTSFHTIGFGTGDRPLEARTPTVLAADALVRELVVACTEDGLPSAERDRLRAVLRDRLRRVDVQPLVLPTAHDPRLADACRLVSTDLSQVRAIGPLARAVGTSERTLTRLFRDEFGTTYPQWRTQARAFQALLELAGGASVTETGRRCGWATTSAFVASFRQVMGSPPGAFRAS